MIFFTIPFGIILVLILVAAGIIHSIIQNIVAIILIVIAIIIVFVLFMKWPGKTFIGLVCVIVLSSAFLAVSSIVKVNETPVYIYRATDTCTFFDEQGANVQIPNGAVVAKFYHPEKESKERQYVGNSYMCYWYFNGEVSSSTVSVIHNGDIAEKMKVEKNIWNLEDIREITYKQFQKNTWWS